MRRFKPPSHAARSWEKPRRVIARVDVSSGDRDTRYIVTNPEGGRGKHLCQKLYTARGHAWKAHLAFDHRGYPRQ
ncbi:MAG: transposase [Rhodobacteraceae bacterium]|nr:transposase [Paracoccaceae bacterium]